MAIAGVASAIQQALRQRMLDEQQQQALAHRQWAVEQELGLRGQGLEQAGEQFNARLGQDQAELGERKRQFDTEAPERDARTGYLRTQTEHLQGTDARTAAERAHDEKMAGIQHGYRLGEIGAASAGKVQPKTMEQELAEFEAKEKIKAQYGGARPSLGAEKNALNYFNRMLEAERNARAVEDDVSAWDTAMSGNIPFVPEFAENLMKSEKGQKYTQAQRMFTEARLRKESGAAIPEGEFANDRRMNFKAVGDKPETMAQKRAARLTTMRGIGTTAGRALQEFYGDDATLDSILQEFAAKEAASAGAPAAGGKPTAADLIKKYGAKR